MSIDRIRMMNPYSTEKLVYSLSNYTCNGTSSTAINTMLRLFNSTDYPYGFKLEFSGTAAINPASLPYGLGSWLGCMDETGSPWPGFVVRHDRNKQTLDMSVNAASGTILSQDKTANSGTTVNITFTYDRSIFTKIVDGVSSSAYGSITHNFPLCIGGTLQTETTWFSDRFGYVKVNSLKVYKLYPPKQKLFRPHEKVTSVYAINSNSDYPTIYIKIPQFYFSASDTYFIETHLNKSYSATRAETAVVAIDKNTSGSCGYYTWMGSDNKAYVAIQARENHFSTSINRYYGYEYELKNGINYQETMEVHINGSKPTVTTNYSLQDNGWKQGSSYSFSNWKTNFGEFLCEDIGFEFGPNSMSNGKTKYFYEMKIIKGNEMKINFVPVKFLDTNVYGLLDLINGGYIDETSFPSKAVKFYSD